MASEQHNALSTDTVVGGCRIERVLGAGGFGITYLATDLDLDRKVAVKEYLPTSLAMRAADGSSVRPLGSRDESDLKFGLRRFRDEAQTLARFSHPNIVGVYKYFEANDTAYLTMPFEEGESLYDILRRHKTLTQDELDEILPPLLDGLEKVHAAGFLHRDIKPGNIYIREADGSPVLLDFGAARQALGAKSMILTSIFTPGYAPFEQYSSKGNQGPWTDIYALAATVYRAVTGKKPPDASERMQVDEIEPAVGAAGDKFSEEFLAALDAALAMMPADRPQSVGEWVAMFRAAPGEATVKKVGLVPKLAARAGVAPARPARAGVRRRHGLRYGIAAAIIAVLGVASVLGYREYDALRAEKAQLAAARLRAEDARRKSLEVRREAEAQRRAAEESRRRAALEAARMEAEAARKKLAEIARSQAEADIRRKAAEAASKIAAEKARSQAEADIRRKAAEAASKIAAEKARSEAKAETRRKAAEAARRTEAREKRRREAAETKRKAAAEAKRKSRQASLGGAARIRSILVGRTALYSGFTRNGRGRVNVELRFTSNAVTRVCRVTTPRGDQRACRTPSGTFRWTPQEPNRVCIHYRIRSACMNLIGGGGAYRLRGFRNGKAFIFVIG